VRRSGIGSIGIRVAVPSMLLAALAGAFVAGPAAAPALAAGSGSGSVQPPTSATGSGSSNGSTYISSIGGGTSAGGSGTPWTPPPCWIQPFFPQTQTYKSGDPSGSQTTDADSYYSWFVSQGAPATESPAQVAAEFKSIQNRKAPAGWTGPSHIEADDVWWAVNWTDNTTGFACAEGLAAENKLSNTYIGLEPPLQNGQQSPLTGAISPYVLSQIARAEITLPKISVVTSPPGTAAKAAVVNTPTYVAVNYQGQMDPSKTKTAYLWGLAPIWASVQATVTSVTVSAPGLFSSSKGFGTPGQTCAAVNGQATPACSVTFTSPSNSNAPDNLTVTVTWKVTWSTSGGTGGTLNSGSQSSTASVTVDEIQSQS
jgi:enoyl reductase